VGWSAERVDVAAAVKIKERGAGSIHVPGREKVKGCSRYIGIRNAGTDNRRGIDDEGFVRNAILLAIFHHGFAC